MPVKFGIGHWTCDDEEEIRSDKIVRKDGGALVQRIDGDWHARFDAELIAYLSIDERSFPTARSAFKNPDLDVRAFLKLANSFRLRRLREEGTSGWKLKHRVA